MAPLNRIPDRIQDQADYSGAPQTNYALIWNGTVYTPTAVLLSTGGTIQAASGSDTLVSILKSTTQEAGNSTLLSLDGGTITFRTGGTAYAAEWGNNNGRTTLGDHLGLNSAALVRWGPNATVGSYDAGLARYAGGVVEINNGTPGQFRDLMARNAIADLLELRFPTGTPSILSVDASGLRIDGTGMSVVGGASFGGDVQINGIILTPASNTIFCSLVDSAGYSCNSTPGLDTDIAIQDQGGLTHTLSFSGGLLVGYTVL